MMNKYYAVADLHGMYTLWRNVLKELDDTDILYILGDCGDRGPRGWDIIKEALRDPRVIYIRGNHDQMLIDAVKNPFDYEAVNLWYWNGGSSTHESIIADPDYEKYINQLARTRFSACYNNINGQIIHLTHAGYTLHENNELPWNEDLLWDREHIADSCTWWLNTNPNDDIIHGHTYCASSVFKFAPNLQLNSTKTVGRYCHGRKICIDGRSFMYNRCALLDLDTLEEKVIESDAKEEILY